MWKDMSEPETESIYNSCVKSIFIEIKVFHGLTEVAKRIHIYAK
jgi:hypothetical protein